MSNKLSACSNQVSSQSYTHICFILGKQVIIEITWISTTHYLKWTHRCQQLKLQEFSAENSTWISTPYAPLLFTNEGIQEATLSSPDNNVLINFLGTLELLEQEMCSLLWAESCGRCASCKPVALQMCGPPRTGGLYLSKELFNTTRRALMKIEGVFFFS